MIDREKVIQKLAKSLEQMRANRICIEDVIELEEAAYDALALLKEQEPRVLSRSEAESYSEVVDRYSEKNPLYVEHKEPHPYNLRWVTNETVGAWMSHSEISKDYGIDFRFWTSRPTEEQRKEVKWDD